MQTEQHNHSDQKKISEAIGDDLRGAGDFRGPSVGHRHAVDDDESNEKGCDKKREHGATMRQSEEKRQADIKGCPETYLV